MSSESDKNGTCDPSERIDTDPTVLGSKIFSWILIAVTLGSLGVLLPLYLKRRNNHVVLKNRPWFVTIPSLVAVVWQLGYIVDFALDREGFPCFILDNHTIIMVFMILLPRVLQVTNVWFKYQLQKRWAELSIQLAVENMNPESTNQSQSYVTNNTFPKKSLFFLSSERNSTIFFSIFTLLVFGYIFWQNGDTAGCLSPCPGDLIFVLEAAGLLVVCVPIALFFLYRIWRELDPLMIVRELWITLASGGVGAGFVIVFNFLASDDLRASGVFTPDIVFSAWALFYIFVFLGLPLKLSNDHDSAKGRNLDSISFNKVLSSKLGKRAFQAFLIAEFSVENLLFWIEANNFIKRFGKTGQGRNERIALLMIEKYIKNGANLQINISGLSREEILENFEKGKVDEFLFADAMKQVQECMEYDSFPRFRDQVAFGMFAGVESLERKSFHEFDPGMRRKSTIDESAGMRRKSTIGDEDL